MEDIQPERKTYRDIKNAVHHRVNERICKDMYTWIQHHKIQYNGEQQPNEFSKYILYLGMYKGLYGTGYNTLNEQCKEWCPLGHTTLQDNIHRWRAEAYKWAKTKIEFGTPADWNQAAEDVALKELVRGTNMWVDSTDFRLTGKSRYRTKDDEWSHKEGSPAQRYLFFSDGQGRVLRIIGGYSPKIRDDQCMKIEREWVEEKLKGAVLVGDGHFVWCKNTFEDPKFHVNFPKPSKERGTHQGAGLAVLTEEQERYNRHVTHARQRVELTFARLKQIWESLNTPWAESEYQQDYMVFIAAACLNETIPW